MFFSAPRGRTTERWTALAAVAAPVIFALFVWFLTGSGISPTADTLPKAGQPSIRAHELSHRTAAAESRDSTTHENFSSAELIDKSELSGRASVIDGDTIEIHGQRIRLNGIDAPESSQTCKATGKVYRCGQFAALALSDFIASALVVCRKTGTDRYRRVVAKCAVGNKDLGRWMVEEGWAIAYRKYSREYIDAELTAKDRQVGLWAGSFIEPEKWRRLTKEERNEQQ